MWSSYFVDMEVDGICVENVCVFVSAVSIQVAFYGFIAKRAVIVRKFQYLLEYCS